MKHFTSIRGLFRLPLTLMLLLSFVPWAAAQAQAPAAIVNQELQPIMPLNEVRIGMKGYGLTVFRGTQIEPFPVEVVSVMHDFGPRRGVIWIRCPDERMQLSGPVQGMSGSPIYLWDPGEAEVIGEGGRLIGAFAYGFAQTRDSYAGVQPIELMRESASRLDIQASADGGASGLELLSTLLAQAPLAGSSSYQLWQAQTLQRLATLNQPNDAQEAGHLPQAPPEAADGQVTRMMLPVAIDSPHLARMMTPMLAPVGMLPMQAPTSVGLPPPGIDANDIDIAGGSVLSVPLVWGDMDLSASGTVTEVWPDGRVLAFGHAMFGQGPIALPMASGFVHLVVPSSNISFKLSGSAVIRGTIGHDENSAVIGSPHEHFSSLPLTVTVNMPGQPQREYAYRVVHHDAMTPMLSAMATARSVLAAQGQPLRSTMRLKVDMTFDGGRELHVDTLLPNWTPFHLLVSIVPPVSAMTQNHHGPMRLQAMHVTADVEPTVRSAVITQAWLDRSELAPGEKAAVTLRIQPHNQPAVHRRVELTVPESLPDGDYPLIICDAATYGALLLNNRPHLMSTANADQLHSIIQRMMSVSNSAVYVLLQLPTEGLAVSGQEMGQLPSSRRALIESPSSTLVSTYRDWVENIVPLDTTIEGQMVFTLQVRSRQSGR
jgi:hypothetical protein